MSVALWTQGRSTVYLSGMVEDDNNLDEIRKLYPQMTDEELRIAQDNFRRYLKALCDIAERLHRESKSINDQE